MFIPNKNYPAFFITINVYRATKIFDINKYCELILKSLEFAEKKYGFKIINYVIMPTHLHFILYFLNQQDSEFYLGKRGGCSGEVTKINNKKIKLFLKTFRSFTAKKIIKDLRNEKSILLSRLVLKKEKIRKHWFSLWKDGEYITIINNKKMLEVKRKYIYDNPIKENLVGDIKDYIWIK